MKVYCFGEKEKPVIFLFPGTCCHWKGNFGKVIEPLEEYFRVACVSYDGFDETEQTEFPTMTEETEKIEQPIVIYNGENEIELDETIEIYRIGIRIRDAKGIFFSMNSMEIRSEKAGFSWQKFYE